MSRDPMVTRRSERSPAGSRPLENLTHERSAARHSEARGRSRWTRPCPTARSFTCRSWSRPPGTCTTARCAPSEGATATPRSARSSWDENMGTPAPSLPVPRPFALSSSPHIRAGSSHDAATARATIALDGASIPSTSPTSRRRIPTGSTRCTSTLAIDAAGGEEETEGVRRVAREGGVRGRAGPEAVRRGSPGTKQVPRQQRVS